MKKIVKNNVKEKLNKYKYNMLLTLIVFILFGTCKYDNSNKDYEVYLINSKINLTHRIHIENNEQYIHMDDLTNVFGENIYNDKISGKLIITTYDTLVKLDKNDDEYSIKKDGMYFFNLSKVMELLKKDVSIVRGKIYIIDSLNLQGKIKKNRTELYDVVNNEVICLLNAKDIVKIYIDEDIKNENSSIVNIQAYCKGKEYYGYVLKQNVDYEYFEQGEQSAENKKIIVKVDTKLKETTDINNIDMVAFNMYRLSGVNALTKLEYTNNIPTSIDLLATINNGQTSSNYDPDILTNMLNSQSNREKIIEQIQDIVKNIHGVNLDFSNFKVSDRDNYTQFVKELSSVMHSNNKIITINVPNTQYIDVVQISKFVDYVFIQPYFSRTLASKTSGPISSIEYVEQFINQIKDLGVKENKVILEVPTHTILWTERRGTVINAEIYNMNTANLYIEENNIQPLLDRMSRQHHISYTKGITTYKMWLEDEYSISKKVELVDKYDLAGVSIYKSGQELRKIYGIIKKGLLK